MTIAIFGATGELGAHVIDALLDRGLTPTDIVALGRNEERLAALESRGVRTARVDLDEPATIDPALEGVDKALLISTNIPGQRLPQHRAAIEAMGRAGVTHLAYTSLLHADSSPLALAEEHRGTEQLIAESGIPATLLRNGWYTENHGDDFAAGRSGVITNAAGDGVLATAARRDYAEAAAAVLTETGHEGKTYELAGSDAWTFADFAAAASEVLGAPVEYRAISQEEQAEQLRGFGVDEGTAQFVAGMYADMAKGALEGDSADFTRLIGRETTPLAEVLRGWK
ncbi:SDR family oxidoreductase [Gulosibacter faecalis]|uniref:SDR family oxidoreductase n=1 Tax=Gulosibacter faecalis TaxID=272240 RepID=A0ABW5UY50_9MICO|nr:SDR family oxidoreductase [Gulosibacter faecalis]